MDFDKFKKISDLWDIQKAFYHSSSEKNEIVLWQNLKGDERSKKKSKFEHYSLDKKEFWLKPLAGMFKFYSNQPLYFYIPSKKLIFKRFIYFNSPLKLIIKEPREIILECQRGKDRSKPQENKRVIIKYGFEKNSQLNSISLKMEVIDFTSRGLALKSNLNNILKFHVNKPIKIECLTDPGSFLDGYVKHITKTFDPKTGELYFKVGIMYKLIA